MPDNLFQNREFEIVNLRPGSLPQDLQDARENPDHVRSLLLADFIRRRFWKPAWLIYTAATAEQQAAFTPDLFRGLYFAASFPNSRYPADWLPETLQILQTAQPEIAQAQLDAMWPFEWLGFANGILEYRENSKDLVLETLALDALDRYQKATGEDLVLTRAVVTHRLGNPSQADALLQAWIADNPDPETFVRALERVGKAGRRAEFEWLALVGSDRIVNAQAFTVASWYWLAFGEAAKARDLLDRAIQMKPDDATILAGVAAAQWATDQREAAQETYRKLPGLKSRRFQRHQEPKPPFAIDDRFHHPQPIPALTELHRAVVGEGEAEP